MSEYTFSNNLLKLYTNKNSNIFSQAGKLACKDLVGKIGIIYDDYDYKGNLKDLWKKDNLDNIFIIAPRRKTISMDDKIMFHKKMKDSVYTPESYLSSDDITDKSCLYFVKKTDSTGGLGVNIFNYDDLLKIDTTNCVIQKNIFNPDLYQNKRYKIRQLVFLYKNKVYLYKNSFFISSNINYGNIPNDKLRDTHVINQSNNSCSLFEMSNKLENFDLILTNIILAVNDFKNYYQTEIKTVTDNDYGVLGFDFIVDEQKNVQIIEINHRSNYRHPTNVSIDCDVGFIKDMIKLLNSNNIENTLFEII